MSDQCSECGANKETSAFEYRKAVRAIAEEIRESIMSGELEADDVNDRLHEEIDGSWWAIYTHAAIAVLTHSSNDGAYIEEYGIEGVADGGMLNWSLLAFAAMEADVREELDVDTWIEERDAAKEGEKDMEGGVTSEQSVTS